MHDSTSRQFVWRLFPLGNAACLTITLENGHILELELGESQISSLKVLQARRSLDDADPLKPPIVKGWRGPDRFAKLVGDDHGYPLGIEAIRKCLRKLRQAIAALVRAIDKDMQPPPLIECGRNKKGYRLADNVVLIIFPPDQLADDDPS